MFLGKNKVISGVGSIVKVGGGGLDRQKKPKPKIMKILIREGNTCTLKKIFTYQQMFSLKHEI